jgi:hypothetical protein
MFGRLTALIVIVASWLTVPAFSQCANKITMLPLSPMKASKPRDFVRFRYHLTSSDLLLIQSHEDTETSIGPYDLGFRITREGKTLHNLTLRTLPELRHEDPYYSQSFATLAISRVCRSEGPMFFVTMKYMGDILSPAWVFILTPSASGYKVSNLPMFSGGTVDVSAGNPFHLRVWDNLNEGMCNACKTAYEVIDYQIEDGKPVRLGKHRTRRLYSSGQFEDSRIRFVP